MATKEKTYAADGTLEDLNRTCQGDENVFRARLVRMEQAETEEGADAINATYERIPFEQPFVKRELVFFDITDSTPDEERDISEAQMQQGHALVFNAEVFLNSKPAKIAVFREQ